MAVFKGKIRQRTPQGTYDYLLPETTIDQVIGLEERLSQVSGGQIIVDGDTFPIENLNNINSQLSSIQSALSNKRDKNVKIKGTDLDISSDENKIKLVNLSDEVHQAIGNNSPSVDGKSAYEIAVDNGFTGTEAQWLQSLKADVHPITYGNKFEWRYNSTTNSLDLVVLL